MPLQKTIDYWFLEVETQRKLLTEDYAMGYLIAFFVFP